MLIDEYCLETERLKLSELEDLTKAKREKLLFYLGMAAMMDLLTRASGEMKAREELIVEYIHDEVQTELEIGLTYLKEF